MTFRGQQKVSRTQYSLDRVWVCISQHHKHSVYGLIDEDAVQAMRFPGLLINSASKFLHTLQLCLTISINGIQDRTTTIGKMIDAYLKCSTELDDKAILQCKAPDAS